MERLAEDPASLLQMLAERIREALPRSVDDAERDQRVQALLVLDDALRRFDEFNVGRRIEPSA